MRRTYARFASPPRSPAAAARASADSTSLTGIGETCRTHDVQASLRYFVMTGAAPKGTPDRSALDDLDAARPRPPQPSGCRRRRAGPTRARRGVPRAHSALRATGVLAH